MLQRRFLQRFRPLRCHLAANCRRAAASAVFSIPRSQASVEIHKGDILGGKGFGCDVVVNSANETLEGTLFPYFPIGAECESGDIYFQDDVVDGLIHQAGGPALSRACRQLPELPPNSDPDGPYPSAYAQRCEIGDARLTEAPDGSELALQFRFVAHAVAPLWAGDLDEEEQDKRLALLKKAYISALRLANEISADSPVRSVAMPLLGAGAKQFPLQLAAKCAVAGVIESLEAEANAFDRLVFVTLKDTSAQALIHEFNIQLGSAESKK